MSVIKQTVKVGAVFSLMGAFAAHSFAAGFARKSKWARLQRRATLASSYSRLGLRILGVVVERRGARSRPEEAALYVGNHLSYLDILILASELPTSFVTSEEIRAVPLLGKLCELGGCLFVERRSRARLEAEVQELSEALRHGLNVTIFPEATSTNGEAVLRFRRPLFRSAKESLCAVVPFCLSYSRIDGEKVNALNRDLVCWYGDMEFVAHLWKLAGKKRIDVRLNWLDRQTDHQINLDMSTESMAAIAHEAVAEVYEPTTSTWSKRDRPNHFQTNEVVESFA